MIRSSKDAVNENICKLFCDVYVPNLFNYYIA